MEEGKRVREDDNLKDDGSKRSCSDDSNVKHINVIEPSLSDANNNSTEKEEECVEGLAFASEAMQQTISEMREKIECWTSKVSCILETGKAVFQEAHNSWEHHIIQSHQKQLETWEEEITHLQSMDAVNEDIAKRLQEALGAMKVLNPTEID